MTEVSEMGWPLYRRALDWDWFEREGTSWANVAFRSGHVRFTPNSCRSIRKC